MDFDKVIDRRGTECTQWDYVQDRFGENNLLPFTISDTDFSIPTPVLNSLINRLNHPIFGYTRWNNERLKSSIINWYKERFDTLINNEWLVYSPSVIYSVSKIIELVSKIGDGVVVQTPAYDAFFKVIEENKRRIVENELIYENNVYRIDFVDLEIKLKDPQNNVLLFCSPHNPTGRVWNEEELKKIIDLCQKYNVYLISDEIHMDVIREGHNHIPITNYDYDKIVLVTSGSKTFNFPGLIFSYLIIPDEQLRERFLVVLKNRDGLSSTSILGMEATIAAYKNCGDWVDELNEYIEINRNAVRNYLAAYLPSVEVTISESTYLMWLDISKLNLTMEEIQKRLITIGKVAIMDGTIYRGNGQQFIRLNIGCSNSKVQDGLTRMRKALE